MTTVSVPLKEATIHAPWPTSNDGWCALFQALDTEYETDPRSPLHHDNRCPIHAWHTDYRRNQS